MATLRNARKSAALRKKNCEERLRSTLPQNTNVTRSQEDHIAQVFEEIEGKMTKKLSKEFNRMENRVLGALLTQRVSSEPANSGALRIRSEEIPEPTWHKPRNEQGRLPE